MSKSHSRSPAPRAGPHRHLPRQVHPRVHLRGGVSRRGFIKFALAGILAWLTDGWLSRGDGATVNASADAGAIASAPQTDVSLPGIPGANPVLPGVSLDRLTYAVFSQRAGQMFRVHLPEAKWVDVELVQAIDLTPRYTQLQMAEGLPVSGECFSLLFRGPSDRPFPQDVYRISHASMGKFGLLLVALLPEDNARIYEAVFNRLLPLM